jgi:predicted enzyme related to lactoylglutathione lyase
MALWACLAGCHTVTHTGQEETAMHNPGAYFEIPVHDLSRAHAFYAQVFGYRFEEGEIHGNRMAFFPYEATQPGITGALAQGETYVPSTQGSLIYLQCADLAAALARAEAAGGQVLFPRTEVEAYGFVAEIRDSEGNRIGLFEPRH